MLRMITYPKLVNFDSGFLPVFTCHAFEISQLLFHFDAAAVLGSPNPTPLEFNNCTKPAVSVDIYCSCSLYSTEYGKMHVCYISRRLPLQIPKLEEKHTCLLTDNTQHVRLFS